MSLGFAPNLHMPCIWQKPKEQTYTSNILIYLTLKFTSGISLYSLYTMVITHYYHYSLLSVSVSLITIITHYYQYQYHSGLATPIMNELGHNQCF